jgi:hypothetical protein
MHPKFHENGIACSGTCNIRLWTWSKLHWDHSHVSVGCSLHIIARHHLCQKSIWTEQFHRLWFKILLPFGETCRFSSLGPKKKPSKKPTWKQVLSKINSAACFQARFLVGLFTTLKQDATCSSETLVISMDIAVLYPRRQKYSYS